MSQLKQEAGIYQNLRQWLVPNKEGIKQNTVITLNAAQSPQEMLETIQRYSITYWNKTEYADPYPSIKDNPAAVAALGLEDDEDPDSYLIEPRYNSHQLEILEDCYISDPVINAAINKYVNILIGPHGKTVLDTRREFSVEQERRDEITRIVAISKYVEAKSEIDKLFMQESISFYTNLYEFLVNYLVYGREAWYIVYDPLTKTKESMGTWKALILLDSRRIGRVKVNKETLQVTHIEYLDAEETATGDKRPAIFNSSSITANDNLDSAWFEVGKDVIYWPHTSGGAGRNTRFTGVSKIESIVHMSQVKRIIMNKNVKEAAETHYMGIGRVQFDPNTPDSIITNFINSMKGAMGRWFAHKVPVTVNIEKMPVDLEKYQPLVDLINRELLRCIGLPSFLLGYEQIANYANSEQILLAARETDIHPLRARLKDFIQMKILDPLFQYYLTNKKTTDIQNAKVQTNNTKNDNNDDNEPNNNNVSVIDEDVKLTYEMEDVSFSTRPENADFYTKINAIVPLPDEAVLRGSGLDNWVEEVQAEKKKREKEKQELKQQFLNNPNVETQQQQQQQNRFNSYSRGAVASGDIDITDPEIKTAVLKTEELKQKLYSQIMKKHAST